MIRGIVAGDRVFIAAMAWVPQLIGSLVHIPVRQRRSRVSGAL